MAVSGEKDEQPGEWASETTDERDTIANQSRDMPPYGNREEIQFTGVNDFAGVIRRLESRIDELAREKEKCRGRLRELENLELYCREKIKELEIFQRDHKQNIQHEETSEHLATLLDSITVTLTGGEILLSAISPAKRPSHGSIGTQKFQDSSTENYAKAQGCGISSGLMYEIKVPLMIFLRCLAADGAFRLASNIEGFGKFNDIVVEQEGAPGRLCIQLKHKQKESLTRSQILELRGKFSILSHFVSYRDEIARKTDEDQFVFYTNANVPSDCSVEPNEDFLTSSENGSSFYFTERDGEVYELSRNVSKYNTFLEHLRDNTGKQPDKTQSEEIIKEIAEFELGHMLPFSETLASLAKEPKRKTIKKLIADVNMLGDINAYDAFLKKYQFYCRQANEEDLEDVIKMELRVLTGVHSVDIMFDELIREFDKWWKSPTPCYLTERHDIWAGAIRNLFRSLSENRLRKLGRYGLKAQAHIVDRYRKCVSEARIAHILVDGECTSLASCILHQALEGTGDSPAIFVGLRNALANSSSVLGAWGSRWGGVLVIEADESGLQAADLFASLAKTVRDGQGKRTLVVVTNVNDLKTTNAVRKLDVDGHVEWRDNISLPDLTDDTQERVLEVEVTFQGHKVPLKDLIRGNEQLKQGVQDFILARLLKGKEFTIGEDLPSPIYYYIPRTLAREGESSGGKRLVDIQDRVVIVTGEPGMGKSTLLSHLAREVKRSDPSMWVIRANISEFTSYFDKIKDDDSPSAIEFLRTVAINERRKCTQFERVLFEECWKTRNRMSVLMDGYDEICPTYERLVKEIFSDIVETGIHRMWITSRILCKETIEQSLQVKAYKLEALNESDQRKFLRKVWSNTRPECELGNLDEFITKILNKFGVSLHDRDKLFTGIPLHTFFIADMFQGALQNISCSKDVDDLFHIDIIELYERFIQRKCEISFSDKRRVDITNAEIKIDFENFVQNTDNIHQLCALVLLLPEDDLCMIHDKTVLPTIKNIIEDFVIGNDVIGIIHSITDGKPVFIHRTLAEYFLAKWFVKNYQQNVSIAERYLLSPSAYVVVDIFNRILSRGFDFHTAVINGDMNIFQPLLQRGDVEVRDSGGRTPLHLAAGFVAEDSFTSLLLKSDADIGPRDNVFRWTALQYADANRNWDNVELLLRSNASRSDLVYTKNNIKNDDYIKSMLRQCCQRGFVRLLTFLFSEGVSANMSIDAEDHRPVHFATKAMLDVPRGGEFHVQDTFEVLLRHGADINVRSENGKTALHFLVESGNMSAIRALVERNMDEDENERHSGTSRLLNVLKGRGDKVMSQKVMTQYRDSDGRTAQELAEQRRMVELASYLGSTLAALDGFLRQYDKYIENPLLLSAVRFLVEERWADVRSRDERENTPLHLACLVGDEHVAEYLVRKGALVTARNKLGDTPLHGAAYSGRCNAVTYLLTACRMDPDELGRNHRTPLFDACSGGHLHMVTYLLQKGASLACWDKHGDTPLHQAAHCGRSDVVRYLVQNCGMDHGAHGFRRQAPLHCACAGGHLDVARFLIDKGSAPDVRDQSGNSPLHRAAQYGRVRVMKHLVEQCKTDIAMCTLTNSTPLHSACQGGHLDAVKYLIEKGAPFDTRDNYGNTTLHIAASFGNVNVVTYLVEECNMALDGLNENKRTALDMACEKLHMDTVLYLLEKETKAVTSALYRDSPVHVASYCGKLTALAYLHEEHTSDVDAKHRNNLTPLHAACDGGHVDVARYLVNKGAKIDACDNYGNTPLHLAAIAGNLDVVTYLTDEGRVDLNAVNYDRISPIHGPCERGHLEVVRILRTKGANPSSRDKNNCTPLHHAAFFGKHEVVRYLIEECRMDINILNNDDLTPLHAACMEDRVEVIKYLVGKGVRRDPPSRHGDTPMHQSAIFGKINSLRYMIEECGVDIEARNNDRLTVLHQACKGGHLQLVEYLARQRGARIDAGDKNGCTAMHHAASSCRVRVLRLLVEECDADVNAVDDDSMTPMHAASDAGQLEAVRYLAGVPGVVTDARDKYGDTPLHRAAAAGKLDVVRYLVEECGHDPNVLNKHYLTPVDKTHAYRQPEVMRYLISVGGKRYNCETESASQNEG